MKALKKILLLILFVLLLLSACSPSSKLSFSEIEIVPNNVQEKIDSSLKLQSITDSGKGNYIVFHSNGEVQTDLETNGDTVTIKFNETNLRDDLVKQNTYYLTLDPEHDVIDILVNGESTGFDRIISGD